MARKSKKKRVSRHEAVTVKSLSTDYEFVPGRKLAGSLLVATLDLPSTSSLPEIAWTPDVRVVETKQDCYRILLPSVVEAVVALAGKGPEDFVQVTVVAPPPFVTLDHELAAFALRNIMLGIATDLCCAMLWAMRADHARYGLPDYSQNRWAKLSNVKSDNTPRKAWRDNPALFADFGLPQAPTPRARSVAKAPMVRIESSATSRHRGIAATAVESPPHRDDTGPPAHHKAADAAAQFDDVPRAEEATLQTINVPEGPRGVAETVVEPPAHHKAADAAAPFGDMPRAEEAASLPLTDPEEPRAVVAVGVEPPAHHTSVDAPAQPDDMPHNEKSTSQPTDVPKCRPQPDTTTAGGVPPTSETTHEEKLDEERACDIRTTTQLLLFE